MAVQNFTAVHEMVFEMFQNGWPFDRLGCNISSALTVCCTVHSVHLQTDIRMNPTSQPIHIHYGEDHIDNKGKASRGCFSNSWTVDIRGPVFTEEI